MLTCVFADVFSCRLHAVAAIFDFSMRLEEENYTYHLNPAVSIITHEFERFRFLHRRGLDDRPRGLFSREAAHLRFSAKC